MNSPNRDDDFTCDDEKAPTIQNDEKNFELSKNIPEKQANGLVDGNTISIDLDSMYQWSDLTLNEKIKEIFRLTIKNSQ